MKKTFLPVLALLLPSLLSAKVVLPTFYSDNMILQQQSSVTVTGTASGTEVTVSPSWATTPVKAAVDGEGVWTATFSTPKAGGPYTLTFDDGEPVTFSNVLIGEVWLCSGQSNMEMPIAGWGRVKDYEKEIAAADYPSIRLYQVERKQAFSPEDGVTAMGGGWLVCAPENVPEFSACAYFFARRLWKELKVPVGVINSSWGGTPAESWVSAPWLADVPGYEQQMADLAAVGYTDKGVRALYDHDRAVWEQQIAGADKGEAILAATNDNPTYVNLPCTLESFLGNFDGVVWYTRTVDVPAAWAGHDLTLTLGAIDDEDITYWNGKKVGSTANWSVNRSYTIPASMVKAGKNTVTLRVYDTSGTGGFTGTADQMALTYTKEQSINLAGKWRYAVSCDAADLPTVPVTPGSSAYPTNLYNAMIYPFRDFPIQGVIWYQGCSNVGRAGQYEPLFQSLICNWRELFGRPDMPFYFVQIANYLNHLDLQPESSWAAIREAQARALRLPNVGMACIIDIGEAGDIHPKNKQEVGSRLAALALNRTYGQTKTICSAPMYEGYTIEGSQVRVRFSMPTGSEPFVADKNLSGFSIQDADGNWKVAEARTDGQTVVVSHPEVAAPVAVRYGWADNPNCTLHTRSGLPVAPFRTDWVSVLEN